MKKESKGASVGGAPPTMSDAIMGPGNEEEVTPPPAPSDNVEKSVKIGGEVLIRQTSRGEEEVDELRTNAMNLRKQHDEELKSRRVRSASKYAMIKKGYGEDDDDDDDDDEGADRKGAESMRSKSMYRAYTPKEKDEMFSMAGSLFLLGLVFAAAVFMFGEDFMLIDGPGFSVWILWQVSVLVGMVCKTYDVPPLLGNLISGIILRNLPGGVVDALPDSWSSIIRATGLSLILMRSGLELDVPMVMKQGWIAARLTVCPGFVEAMVVGGVSTQIFGMPIALAFALGFILAAVSPAVVVGGMFNLQKLGYGVAKGIPSLVVAAASFDDVVAISGYSMCIGAAINTGHDPTLSALEGPINIVAGVVVGAIGGSVCGMTRLFNTKVKRTLVCVAMGLFLMYVSLSIHYHGAGALAGLVTTISASYFWQNEAWNKYLPDVNLSLPASDEWHHETEHDIALVWEYAASPLLFAVIGASINFSVLDASIIPYSIAIVCCGAAVRVPTAILVTGGKNLTWIERSFVGLAWIPKATVQAALGSVPLDIVLSYKDQTDSDFDDYKRWGEQILVTAVVAILITAPIGLICINALGEKWLTLDVVDDDHEETKGLEMTDRDEEGGDTPKNVGEKATSTTGLSSSSSSISEDQSGTIQISKFQESFIDGVTSVFAEYAGRQANSAAAEKQQAKDEMNALARRVGISTKHNHKKRRLANWEKNEQRKRMTIAATRQLNKRLVVHYFHRTTDHIETIEGIVKRTKEISERQGGLTAANIESLRLGDALHSAEAIMEATMACFRVIEGMEENFPAEDLYHLIDDENGEQSLRRGSKTAYDAVSGQVVYKSSTDGSDPMSESIEVLKRRGSSVGGAWD
jgi:NhaP-type Na+/H+ or K+/H+ antiporter